MRFAMVHEAQAAKNPRSFAAIVAALAILSSIYLSAGLGRAQEANSEAPEYHRFGESI